MPIKIPGGLPARAILDSERIFALEKPEAERQRVRPLKMVILNLMPKKIETETQLLRLISKSPLQVEIDFMKTSTHESKHVSADHLVKFYEPLEAYEGNCYDGLIVTGAPVEHLRFEDVDYWDEFKRVLDWSSTHVFSTMYMCWGAMAALYQRYGVHKMDLDEKLFGVFPQFLQDEYCFLTNGFDEIALQPHSRLAGVNEADIAANPELQVLTWGPQAGPGLIATRDFSEVFALGHWEYGKYTLAEEYRRDMAKGMSNVPFPRNYFPNDDPALAPLFSCCGATGSTGYTRQPRTICPRFHSCVPNADSAPTVRFDTPLARRAMISSCRSTRRVTASNKARRPLLPTAELVLARRCRCRVVMSTIGLIIAVQLSGGLPGGWRELFVERKQRRP